MDTKIKWVKFYETSSSEVITYNVEEKVLQHNGQTHSFASAEEAIEKSTVEVFTFWDGVAIGAGSQSA